MKVEVWSSFWCLVLITCFPSLSACEDYSRHCSEDKCKQPGIWHKCQKTCGRCHNATIQTECPDQTWGSSCMKNCSVGCLMDRCDKNSSTCDCKPCYEGLNCSDVSDRCNCSPNGVCECKAGWFGTGCTRICPENCFNEICGSNGTCTQGCTTGWHGVKCDKCSEHCVRNLCSLSGTCMGGCDAGWFGESCGQPCPNNCNSETCDKNNGSCTLCYSGYKGPHCNTSCPDNCKGKTCNQTDGTCPACEFGWFGRTCTSWCPENCELSCNQSDGTCSKCKVGWFGRLCEYTCSHCKADQDGNQCDQHMQSCLQGCTDGWFGDKCEHRCSKGCEKELCEQETGRCTEGCHQGAYGEFCNMSCSERCKDQICSARMNVSHVDGLSLVGDSTHMVCTLGCESGWFRDDCSYPCPSGCESCTREDGRCSTSGINGLVVWVVLPVVIITLLLIVTLLRVARLKKTESFKRGKYTNQMRGFNHEGALSEHGDEDQLLSSRRNQRKREPHTRFLLYSNAVRDLSSPPPLPSRDPPHLVRPSPAPIYSEPDLGDEESESYIVVKHLFE